MVDSNIFGLWAQALTFFIALSIALLALKGYIRFRITSSFLLSASFFLLACTPFLAVLELLGLFQWPDPSQWYFDYVTQTIKILNVVAIVQILAFIMLSAVYITELRNKSVELSRLQMDALAASLALVIVYSLFIFNKYSGNMYGHPVLPFLSAILSVALMLLIVTLMLSFYRAKGLRNTLLGMAGFLLILVSAAFQLLSFDPDIWTLVDGASGGMSTAFIVSLFGYIVFLLAIVETRVRHGVNID